MTPDEFWWAALGWVACWLYLRFCAAHRARLARRRFRELAMARHRRERDEGAS